MKRGRQHGRTREGGREGQPGSAVHERKAGRKEEGQLMRACSSSVQCRKERKKKRQTTAEKAAVKVVLVQALLEHFLASSVVRHHKSAKQPRKKAVAQTDRGQRKREDAEKITLPRQREC